MDKNAAYPRTVEQPQKAEDVPRETELRAVKYLNNIVEKDQRGIKRLTEPGIEFRSLNTARKTLKGYELLKMFRKGQIVNAEKEDILGQSSFMNEIFGIAV